MDPMDAPPAPAPCPNASCAQYRIQHRNMTLKKIELEKELEQLRRAQDTTFNRAVAQNAVTQFRDAATGEMGLMMPNGEIMTREKVMKKMEIAAKCMETSCAYEKKNRELVEENTRIKAGAERTFNEMRRLERILAGFERTRTFEFTQEHHKQTLKLNEELACEVETLEYEMHRLQEENALLKRKNERMQRELTRRNSEQERRPSPATPRITKKKRSSRKSLESSDEEEPTQWEQFAATPIHPRSPSEACFEEEDVGDGEL